MLCSPMSFGGVCGDLERCRTFWGPVLRRDPFWLAWGGLSPLDPILLLLKYICTGGTFRRYIPFILNHAKSRDTDLILALYFMSIFVHFGEDNRSFELSGCLYYCVCYLLRQEGVEQGKLTPKLK